MIQSMKRLHGYYVGRGGLKEHGEHLAPLQRFLASAVGRLWDEVMSELTRLDRRSIVQRHVLFHVDGYVNRHVVMIDGVPHMHVGHRDPPRELWDDELYVDPRTDLLCQHHHRRWK